MEEERMRNRWLALCERRGAWGPIAERSWNTVIERRYGEAWRFYHTLAHIGALLEEFDGVRSLFEDADSAEFAIWFHDIVYDCYDPRITDNEKRSAEIADQELWTLLGHLPAHIELSKKVSALILATKHDAEPADADARLLADLDLAILGKPEEVFEVYEKQIAEEYTPRPYSREAYREGRVDLVLKPFLGRPRIYYTPHFYGKYEAQARLNLKREMAKLESE